MAGGEGTRLRPLTQNQPKPMVDFIEKPVLHHIIELLKRNGIYDICLTLRYLPKAVTEYFGDGSEFGVRLTSRIEDEPLGTAGSVRACEDFLGDEDFLVISGDAICNFDLKDCIDFHRRKEADVTIVLYSHENPLEYGLVVTNPDGKIERFIEKPSWDMVFTNNVNTGIYIISGEVLKEIPPDCSYDFGKDLFPKLVKEGRKIYGVGASGYWCDIGNCEAYLECAKKALGGLKGFEMAAPQVRPGVYSKTALPGEAPYIEPPVYIGENVTLEPGARIGPYAVIGDNSVIGRGASVRDSVIQGADIGRNAVLYGAIVGKGAAVGKGTALSEGCVIGEKTVIGEGATVAPKVKIWPEREIPNGAKVSDNIITGMLRGGVTFGADSAVSGEWGVTVTPEVCMSLGAACAVFGRTGIAQSGGKAAKVAAKALDCGVLSSGGKSLTLDSTFEAETAFAAGYFGLPVTVFIKQDGNNIKLSFCGAHGTPLNRGYQRKIESAAAGEFKRANAENTGETAVITGISEAYGADCASFAFPGEGAFRVSVQGKGSENRALSRALRQAGFEVTERGANTPCFEILPGGFQLTAEDEEGRKITPEQMLVLTALCEFENGSGEVAVPFGAPAAIDVLAGALGTKALRVGRDGERAEELFLKQSFMRDGVKAAVRIASALRRRSEPLSVLRGRMPRFSSVTREILLNCDRGAAMKKMAAACSEMAVEFAEGLRLSTERGWVQLSPCHDRPALRIKTESENAEMAEALCVDFERRAQKAGIRLSI